MEGLKRKVIIAILTVVALLLGYQACQACNLTIPQGAPPYHYGNYVVFCREHFNDFTFGNTGKKGATYHCVADYETEPNGAYGFAYFLSRASDGTIQRWVWDHSGTANGQYILNANTDFEAYFTGFMSNLGLEEAFSDATLGDSSEQNKFEPQPIINFWNDPTINIVDSVPYEFFEKVYEGDPSDPESKEIKDITYDDYNYVYQLTFLFDHMNNNLKNSNKKLTVADLEKHIEAYLSDSIGSVVMHADTSKNKGCMITNGIQKDILTKNCYGQSIRLWECNVNNGKVTYWAYDEDRYNGDKNTYNTIYMIEGWHTDANNNFVSNSSLPNTAKFDKSILTIGDKISLQDYLNIFYNKDMKSLKTKLNANGHTALANLLPNSVSSNQEMLSVFNGIYVKYRNEAYELAVNSKEEIEEQPKIEMPDSGDNLYFKFSGSVKDRAKIYQYLRKNNYLKQWAETKFSIDKSDAKMSIDAKNQKYIIGPFVMHYPTIVLGDETILGLDPNGANGGMSLTIKYDNTTKKLEMNKDFTLIRENEYNTLVRKDGSKIEVPKSGDKFYIELNKDVKGKGTLLDKDDEITLNADFKYLESVTATVHFLQAVGDNDVANVYSTSHPQRFIAILSAKKDAMDHWKQINKSESITPSYVDLEILKVDEKNNKLGNAIFKALAVYQAEDGTKKYLNLADQLTEYNVPDSNNEYSVLDNDNVPKYYTPSEGELFGKIVFQNIAEEIAIKDSNNKVKVYTFQKAIAKEIEAPNGYALDNTPFDISKNNGYTVTHQNHEIKPYDVKIRKVDENGNPISGLKLKVYNLDLTKSKTSKDEKNEQQLVTDQVNPKYPTSGGYAIYHAKMYSDKIALVIEEQPEEDMKLDYKYFKKVVLIYSTVVDKQGNVSLKFLNGNEAGNFNAYDEIKPGIEFENGQYLLVTENGDVVYGKDTEEYLKTGETGTDVILENHKAKPYNLSILKVDENGNKSKYLNGTRFKVAIAKNNKNVFSTKQPIVVQDGIAKLSDLTIYGDNLSLYLQEIPVDGYKTNLTDLTFIFNYSANKDGKVVIDYDSINMSALYPEMVAKLENLKDSLLKYITIKDGKVVIDYNSIDKSELDPEILLKVETLKDSLKKHMTIKDGKVVIDFDSIDISALYPEMDLEKLDELKEILIKHVTIKDGKIMIDYGSINIPELYPQMVATLKKLLTDNLIKYDNDSMAINLTVENKPEDYTLKFRKTDEEGNPLIGATFTLMDKAPATAGSSLATKKQDTSKEPDGYMEFTGFRTSENENDFIELYLFENAAPAGYTSDTNEHNPVIIRYVYMPGSGKLEHLSIIHNEKKIVDDITLEMSKAKEDEGKIVFNFGELNEIFTLVNKPNPYDLDLFTKKDEEGNPIAGIHFKVSVYKADKDGTHPVYAKYKLNKEDEDDKAIEIKDLEVISQGDGEGEVKGRVFIPNVIDYGTYNVRIQELADENGEYQLIDDIMTLTFTKNKGDEEDNKVVWGNKLVVTSKVLDESGNVVKDEDGKEKTKNTEYTRADKATCFKDKDGKAYKYITIDQSGLSLEIENHKNPYNLVINKINGLSKDAIANVPFTVEISNNGEGDEYKHITREGQTTDKGEIIIKDIDIYSTEKLPKISVTVTENVPTGFSGSEYEYIWFVVNYEKYTVKDKLQNIEISDIYANLGKDKDGNQLGDQVIGKGNLISLSSAEEKEDTLNLQIPNMPTFDLPIFYKYEDINGNEIPIKEGVTFTAKVKDSNGQILKDYTGKEIEFKCELNSKDGLVTVKDIDVGKLFIDENGNLKAGAQSLSLVVKEEVYEIYQELEDITIDFSCEYKDKAWKTNITKYTYQDKSIEVKDVKDKDAKQFAGQSLYVKMEDEDGTLKPAAYVLNKKKVEVAPLAIKKVDENGNTVAGIEFVGKIYKADDKNVFVAFDETTNENGIASINMSKDDAKKLLGDAKTANIKVVIEEEKWSSEDAKKAWQEKAGIPDGDLEFIKNVTITGLSIDETETATTVERMIKGFDKAKSDNNKVTINKTTLEVVVENGVMDYPMHLIKTTESLLENENAERLKGIPFDITIKNGESDTKPLQFNDIETEDKGEINLKGITKFGDVTLTLKEKQPDKNSTIKILNGEVYVRYTATVVTDKDGNKSVKIEVKEIKYQNSLDEGKVVPTKDGELEFNVINPKDYSITLKKKVRVNSNENTTDSTVPVRFKGFITTNQDLAYNVNGNEKTIKTYDQFNTYVDNHKASGVDNTIFFDDLTTSNESGEQTLSIGNLKFYDKQVYVYFIETDVPSSMETIKEVMWASFNKKMGNTESKGVSDSSKVSVNTNNPIDITVTAINEIIPYKVNLIKIDSATEKPIDSFSGAIFEINLKVLDEENENQTNSVDTARIEFKEDGTIDSEKSTLGKKYILGMNLVEENGNQYIQLDINKFGHLQFEIKELKAPKNYKKFNETLIVEYTVYPQTEEGKTYVDSKSINTTPSDIINAEAQVASEDDSQNAGNLLSLDIRFKNTPEEYTIPVKKVILKADGSLAPTSDANGIQFRVKFFDLENNRIMQNIRETYVVENGKFETEKIDKFEPYYMALEETQVNDNVIQLEGIHVFKVTPNINIQNKIDKIEYMGTGKIDNEKLTLTGDKSKEAEFGTEEDGISFISIPNHETNRYSIDLLKVDEADNPLEGASFTVTLAKSNSKFETGETVFSRSDLTSDEYGIVPVEAENNKGLKLIGTYKVIASEDQAPRGMKKTFDKVEFVYSTADGKKIDILDAKVWKDGVLLTDKEANNVISWDDTKLSQGHVELSLTNVPKKPVSLSIYKEYVDREDNSNKKLPIQNVMFKGMVTEVETGYTWDFESKETDKNGNVYIGSYKIEGEVEVTLTEMSTPSGFDKIPQTSIKVEVDDGKIDMDSFMSTTNGLAEITDDNELVAVNTTTYDPKISFEGFVWEEIPVVEKGGSVYKNKGWYDENIDHKIPTVDSNGNLVSDIRENDGSKNYDTQINEIKAKIKSGVIVTLWDSNNNWVKITQTDKLGSYSFDVLDPFTKYYITFELVNANKGVRDQKINDGKYDGNNYESVNYLVQSSNGESYTGDIKNVVGNEYWDKNSKAVMDGENSDRATTTASAKSNNKQLYPLYDQFTIGYITEEKDEITLYISQKEGKYYIEEQVGSQKVNFKSLSPSNNSINLGIIRKKTFDLELTKDVKDIIMGLDNGSGQQYNFGLNLEEKKGSVDGEYYSLKINQADAKRLAKMQISYTIKVANKDLAKADLKSIADYYNKDILKPVSWKFVNNSTTNELKEDTSFSNNQMIPVQTYKYEGDTFSKDVKANTGRTIINIDKELNYNDEVYIEVTYEYLDNFIKEIKGYNIGDEYATLGLAEVFDDGSAKSGRYDLDSYPGDMVERFNKNPKYSDFYEDLGEYIYYGDLHKTEGNPDDEDAAPALKIMISDGDIRTISGKVFEDTNGDQTFNNGEQVIQGINVALYEEGKAQATDVKTTDQNGNYTFKSMPAGQYHLEFTYGDENTILPTTGTTLDKQSVTIGDKTYRRYNDKSYNALEFEDVYNDESEFNSNHNGDYWYIKQDSKSDAIDSANRNEADNLLNKNGKIMNNEKAERLYSYKGDTNEISVQDYIKELSNVAVTAKTNPFKVTVENTIIDGAIQYQEVENGKVSYYTDQQGEKIPQESLTQNIDFGIKERPQSDVSLEKEVDHIVMLASNGNTNVDATYNDATKTAQGTAPRVQWFKGNGNDGYIWIQRSDEEVTGAILQITYKITVKNRTDEKIKVTVVDYVQEGMAFNNDADEQNKKWDIAVANTTEAKGSIIKSNKYGEININKNIDLNNVSTLALQEVEIEGKGDKSESYEELYITLTKRLNAYSQSDIDAYTNYAEIIQTDATGGNFARKDIDSIPGDFDPNKNTTISGNLGKVVTTVDEKFGLEKDSAKAIETVSITAETGENRETTYYILAFSTIAIFATGVGIIIDKVMKKK